jgi:exopolysaccharide biosynthesis polyprenyl glycosylphosphotransferase
VTAHALLARVRRGALRREPAEPETRTAYASSLVAERYGQRDLWLRRALLAGDAIAVAAALALATLAQSRGEALQFVGLGLLTLPIWLVVFRMYGLYERDVKKLSHTSIDDLPAAFHALMVGTLLMWAYYKVLPIAQLELGEVLVFGVAAMSLMLLLRLVARRLATRALGPERVLLVGGGDSSRLLSRKLGSHPEYNAIAVGVLTNNGAHRRDELAVLGDLRGVDLHAVIREHDVERVVISHMELDEETMLDLVRDCKRLGLKVNILPQLFDAMGTSVTVDHVEGVTVLGLNPPVLSRSARVEKRALDIVCAGLLVLVTAPLLAVIALAIKLTSRGPVLFRQQRIGKGGCRFEVFKFRTMVANAESMTEELFAHSEDPNWLKLERDPRITSIGRILRMSSLDELPQLVNVLKGDMSLVGPRPLQESEDRAIGGWGRTRLDLTPGVTGLWQVLGRTNIPFEEMVKLDYQYVTNWSLWTDVRLILQTVPAVLRQRGAN